MTEAFNKHKKKVIRAGELDENNDVCGCEHVLHFVGLSEWTLSWWTGKSAVNSNSRGEPMIAKLPTIY